MAADLNALQRKLPVKTAALIESPIARRYFTGFSSSQGLLLISGTEKLFLTDARYIEAAKTKINICPVAEFTRFKEQIPQLLQEWDCELLLVETRGCTLDHARALADALPRCTVDIRDTLLDKQIEAQRRVKSPSEIDALCAANRIADKALLTTFADSANLKTERSLSLALENAMRNLGSQGVSFDTIVATGANAAIPHHVPGETVLRQGDMLVIDFGAVVDGYHSDCTRTVFIGEAKQADKDIYALCLEAHQEALHTLKSGVAAKEVDAAARRVIASAGYGAHFRHSTGHGVGLEIHEAPTLHAAGEEVLQAGMVVTVEPGIYLPGERGVRIEDMVAVSETEYSSFTTLPKEIWII
jgi:Xaa-Pro aminopeptidase